MSFFGNKFNGDETPAGSKNEAKKNSGWGQCSTTVLTMATGKFLTLYGNPIYMRLIFEDHAKLTSLL
jgi:hypothetical protein